MSATYTHKFDTPVYKGDITIHTGQVDDATHEFTRFLTLLELAQIVH
jgi:hypothetical protein